MSERPGGGFPSLLRTRHSDSLFDPFNSANSGMFWYDRRLHDEMLDNITSDKVFEPVTLIEQDVSEEPVVPVHERGIHIE